MKRRITSLIVALLLLAASAMATPFAHEASPDIYAVLFENDHVRVLEMILKPGDMDEWHVHPDETVYFAEGGRLTIHVPDGGSVTRDVPKGAIMWHETWEHQVENTGPTTVRAIIVEDVGQK